MACHGVCTAREQTKCKTTQVKFGKPTVYHAQRLNRVNRRKNRIFETNADHEQQVKEPPAQAIYYASYRDTERWCFRKLLLRVSGAASCDDLKKVPKTENIKYIAEFQNSVEDQEEEFEDEDFVLTEPVNNSQEEEEETKMELDKEDWVSPNRQQQPLYQDNKQKAEEYFQFDC